MRDVGTDASSVYQVTPKILVWKVYSSNSNPSYLQALSSAMACSTSQCPRLHIPVTSRVRAPRNRPPPRPIPPIPTPLNLPRVKMARNPSRTRKRCGTCYCSSTPTLHPRNPPSSLCALTCPISGTCHRLDNVQI